MYRSRELSGVSIKTAGILNQDQPTEQVKHLQACGKIRLIYFATTPIFIVVLFTVYKSGKK